MKSDEETRRHVGGIGRPFSFKHGVGDAAEPEQADLTSFSHWKISQEKREEDEAKRRRRAAEKRRSDAIADADKALAKNDSVALGEAQAREASAEKEIAENLTDGKTKPQANLSLEHRWLDERRKILRKAGGEPLDDRPVAGLALSGGGIRSATFSLGVLQALGARELIYKFDYLSTVSGGSYIGGFFGGLFAKRDGAPALIVGRPDKHNPFDQAPQALRQLRQFGRYLAPSGTGDLLRGVSVVVRNVIAVHLVLGTFIMWVALLGAAARVQAGLLPPKMLKDGLFLTALQQAPLLATLALPLFLFFSLGWAFWLTPRGDVPDANKPGHVIATLRSGVLTTPILIAIVAFCVSAFLCCRSGGHNVLADVIAAASLIVVAGRTIEAWWSGVITVPILGTVGLFTTASYFAYQSGGGDILADIIIPVTLCAVARRLYISLDDSRGSEFFWDRERSRLTTLIAFSLGLFLLFLAASAADTAGYWLWRIMTRRHGVTSIALPAVATTVLIPYAQKLIKKLGSKTDGTPMKVSGALIQTIALTVVAVLLVSLMVIVWVALAYLAVAGSAKDLTAKPELSYWHNLGLWAIGLGLTAWVVGTTTTFVNQSSLSTLYSARLRRAYLGAGNAMRIEGKVAVDREHEGDDIRLSDYYYQASASPLHLINVTINETKSKGSNVVQRDRHGRNLVLSPAGIFHTNDRDDLSRIDWEIGEHERLPLSSWIGISGAAFSTGLGAKTNIRLSLLAGLSNMRLGYWWRRLEERSITTGEEVFSTQRFLANELMASFPGIDGPYWYLSDGGHFENTAAYELIRRRVPFIVISDNGADEQYQYEDVANLVRKARIDFDCDIDFLPKAELDACLGKWTMIRKSFGTLTEITGDTITSPTAIAALARVTYRKDGLSDPNAPVGTLVLIKPRLTGDGPQDLIRYKAANKEFPQQTTLDQFFDEDQWESYYHLGYLIGRAVFTPNDGLWSPHGMLPLPQPKNSSG